MKNEGNEGRAPRRRAKMAAALAAVFAVGAVGGGALVAATDAWSHGGRWGGSMGHHGDPARWKGHFEDRALFILDRMTDVSDEQREAVREIVGEAAGEVAGALGEHRELRRAWITELEREELDEEGLEALRAKHVALLDRKSRMALDAIVRVGAVLTPEQRGEIVSVLSWHRGRARREAARVGPRVIRPGPARPGSVRRPGSDAGPRMPLHPGGGRRPRGSGPSARRGGGPRR